MLDLSQSKLPNTIEIDGAEYEIRTSFRVWLNYYKCIKENKFNADSILYLFANEHNLPVGKWEQATEALQAFFTNPNSTPNYHNKKGDRLMDYIEDGEYIYASFFAVYGIDLLEVDMHWWVFKALFIGLPDDSKIKQIMSMRGYTKSKQKIETMYEKNKRAWALPKQTTEKDKETMEEIDKILYNS